MSKVKVIVGLSGGVDSSVCAYLLKEQGYEVIGVTMKTWTDEELLAQSAACGGKSAIDDARAVANTLGIDYHVVDFVDEFQESVKDYFVEEWQTV